MDKIKDRISIFILIVYLFAQADWPAYCTAHADKIAPPPIFPTSGVKHEAWFGDVSIIISDVTDTLVSPNVPVDRSGLVDIIKELVDLGVVFCPLTSMGYGRLKKALLDYIPIRRANSIIAAVQNGGIVLDAGTAESINEVYFPDPLKGQLHSIIRTCVNNVLMNDYPALEWYFQPREPERLRSVLFVSFAEKEGIEDILPVVAIKLRERLKKDPAITPFLVDGELPFSITASGQHIIISVVNKEFAVRKIIEKVAGQGPKGVAVVMGNSGGETGNDSQMLKLRTVGDIPIRTVYAGKANIDWAVEAGIDIVPREPGPVGVIEFLNSVAVSIKKRLRKELSSSIKWHDIKPEVQEILQDELLNTDLLDRTLSKFNLSLNDVSSVEVKPLGAGGENYVCAISFVVKPEKRQKVEGIDIINGIINVSAVISHSTYNKEMRLAEDVHQFLRRLEMARLESLTSISGGISKRPFPRLYAVGKDVHTREWLDGKEIGEVMAELSIEDRDKLADILTEASRCVVDFWHRVTNHKWLPMVHDDDILVRKTTDGRFVATLPDLGTPLYRSPGIRVLDELMYLSYELVQIFYDKLYDRHSLLDSSDVQMMLYSIFSGILEALGEEEGKGFFHSIIYYCKELKVPLKEETYYEYNYLIGYMLRVFIESFFVRMDIPLPEIKYPRPEEHHTLDWRNTTEMIDKMRRFISIEEKRKIPSLTLPRPYDDRTQKFGSERVQADILRVFKSNAKTFNRIGEVVLALKNMDIGQILAVFPRDTYTYNFIEYLQRQGKFRVYPEDYPEILYTLAKDFNLAVFTIPSDWIRLYRLFYYDCFPEETHPPRMNFYMPVPSTSGHDIELRINEDLGEHAFLWHPTSNLLKTFSFDVYVDGKHSGMLVFSIIDNTLILQQIRLSKRQKGVGTDIMIWIKGFMEENRIEYLQTFDFVHFILIHILHKVFGDLEVLEKGNWVKITQEEAQKLAIDNPTGYRFRAKVVIDKQVPLPFDLAPSDRAIRGSA